MFGFGSEIVKNGLYVVVAVLVLCVVALWIGYYYRGKTIKEQSETIDRERVNNIIMSANYDAITEAVSKQNDMIESLRVDIAKKTSQYDFASKSIEKTYEIKKQDDRDKNETECDGMKRIISEEWGAK